MPTPSPLQEFMDLYVSLGLEQAGKLYIRERPPKKNPPCTVVSETDSTQHPEIPLATLLLKVQTQDQDQQTAYDKAFASHAAMHGLHNVLLPHWRIAGAYSSGEPTNEDPYDGAGPRIYSAAYYLTLKVCPRQ